jgi:hypothetical protein
MYVEVVEQNRILRGQTLAKAREARKMAHETRTEIMQHCVKHGCDSNVVKLLNDRTA